MIIAIYGLGNSREDHLNCHGVSVLGLSNVNSDIANLGNGKILPRPQLVDSRLGRGANSLCRLGVPILRPNLFQMFIRRKLEAVIFTISLSFVLLNHCSYSGE